MKQGKGLITSNGTRKNDNNYCYVCGKKLTANEKGDSSDSGFYHNICKRCAYTLSYEYIAKFGFPNNTIKDKYREIHPKVKR